MKKIFLMLAMGAMMLTACDKVDEYTSFAGAIGEWTDGNGVADKSQRALVEKYTGAHCKSCPDGDKIIQQAHEKYGDKMIAIAIDGPGANGMPFEGEINTHTEEGDAWAEAFGVSYLPVSVINRQEHDGAILVDVGTIPNTVESIISGNAPIAVAIESSLNAQKSNITVNLEYLEAISEPLTLTLLVIEDSIKAKQLTPTGIDKNYMHNHVLRDVITDLWGMEIKATGAQGERRKVVIPYEVNPSFKIENCYVVAFVAKKDSREVINSASCKL